MVQRRIPLTLYRPAKAGVYSFAGLAALEAAARALVISVFPVLLYRNLGSAEQVSQVYFTVGLVSLVTALLTPFLAQHIPRRWLYTLAVCSMICGNLTAIIFGEALIAVALMANTVALVVQTVCFNAYVMDYIERTSLGKNESARLVLSGASWAIGPFLGVWLMEFWPQGPFVLAVFACVGLLGFFWFLRLGDGKAITRAKKPAANPLIYLPHFFAKKLLVAGWLFSVFRSIGWQVYIVYLPIFAVQNGLGNELGGLALSISNAFLFLAPLMFRFVVQRSVRLAIFMGFAVSGILYVTSTLIAGTASLVVVQLLLATLFLVLLDVSAGLPFLMSVKPSERTEMAAVYSTFRDVSAVATPGIAWLVLLFAPVSAIFVVTGMTLVICALIAAQLHPRLGKKRTGS